MNSALGLTSSEIDALSSHDRTLAETARIYEHLSTAKESDASNVFERALRIKMTLDMFEESAKVEPTEKALAFLINGENQLRELYVDTPIRNNPFLSHWVEAVQRLETHKLLAQSTYEKGDIISRHDIALARMLWIKTLLQNAGADLNTEITPIQLAQTLLREGLSMAFDIHLYIRVLEEEGIYEGTPADDSAAADSHTAPRAVDGVDHRANARGRDKLPLSDAMEQWKATMPQKLEEDRDRAIFDLARLPVELPALDYLTTLLADHVLEAYSIDPGPVVTQFIQHALRTVERMERPPSGSDPESNGHLDLPVQFEQDLEYGKEPQSRAVRLLLLFIKSLIRKGLIAADVLYFEIQEICIRYVWIKEVREFRIWVEEGIAQDSAT